MSDGFELTGGAARGPHPSTVPGFGRARELGLLPRAPADPPAPVCLSSTRASLLFLVPVVGSFLLVVWAGSQDWSGLAMLPLALLCFGAIVSAIVVPSRLRIKEYAAGYCRADRHIGISVLDKKVRFQNGAGPAGAEWDLRGLWRLDAEDRAVRPPDPAVLPPGHYPSPHEPGRLEYWTGRDWHYMLVDPPTPFLP